MASGGSRRRSARGFRDEAPGSQGCTEIPEAYDEALRPAAINCNRPATVVPIGDENNWERRQPGVWSVAQQSGRKFPPAVPTTRTRDAEVQGRKDPTEICRRPRINPQPLQPRPPPQPPRHLQTEPRCRTRGMASACSLTASDQHPSQARLGLSDNAGGSHPPGAGFLHARVAATLGGYCLTPPGLPATCAAPVAKSISTRLRSRRDCSASDRTPDAPQSQ